MSDSGPQSATGSLLMPPSSSPSLSQNPDTASFVVNQISAMVAYWDANQRCVFANAAYRHWFGRSPEEMIGLSMRELLGELYEKNLPYIEGALAGEPQIFERRIPLPDGGTRDSVATYTPDVVDGVVRGFSVHVADVTLLRQREATLSQTIKATIEALEKTKGSFRSRELGRLREQLGAVLERLQGP